MRKGIASTAIAGKVHHPAWAAITPPVAATENIGPTLEIESGTRSLSSKDCDRRRVGAEGASGGSTAGIVAVLLIIGGCFHAREQQEEPIANCLQ